MTTAEQLIKTYENQLNEFQEWIETQSRLPKNIGEWLVKSLTLELRDDRKIFANG